MAKQIKNGDVIRHFEIIDEIGRGGMAHIHLAYDNKLKRHVAIKSIRNDKLERESVKRFISEARTLAQLNHTNISNVYDIEKIDGNYFLIMEYLNGVNFKDYLKNNDFLFGDLLRMGRDLAHALSYIHSKGIIHRDIKPSNIIVTNELIFKIIDFGISKWGNDPSAYQTRTNFFVGSIRYLAPEVYFNNNGDHRSDIYSFGQTILFALLGRTYVQGKTTQEVLNFFSSNQQALPDILEHNLPDEFKDMLFYLIHIDPAKRCPNMNEALKLFDDLIPQVPEKLMRLSLSKMRTVTIRNEDSQISHRKIMVPHRDNSKSLPKISRSEQLKIAKNNIEEAGGRPTSEVKKTNEKVKMSEKEIPLRNHLESFFDFIEGPKGKVFMSASLCILVITFVATKFEWGNEKDVYVGINEQVDFQLEDNKPKKNTFISSIKSNHPLIHNLLKNIDPTIYPELFASIVELDESITMAKEKNVELSSEIDQKLAQIQRQLNEKNKTEALATSKMLNTLLAKEIIEEERRSVNKAVSPRRLPASSP